MQAPQHRHRRMALLASLVGALVAVGPLPAHAVPAAVASTNASPTVRTVTALVDTHDGPAVRQLVVPSGLSAGGYAARLRGQPDVLAADVDHVYTPAIDGVTDIGTLVPEPQWERVLDTTRAADAWGTTRGSGVIVAVLDAGVDPHHPDLAGALPEVNLSDTAEPTTSWHATGVAGLAGGAVNGVGTVGHAPEATVLPVRVCGAEGCVARNVARGILYAVERGARVINLSLAGPEPDSVQLEAIRYARARGVVVVAAAGNAGTPCSAVPDASCGNLPFYPAAHPEVIAVGGITFDAATGWAQHGRQVDLAAPAERVPTIVPTFAFADPDRIGTATGTSHAAPQVAGTAALVMAAAPELSPADVQAAMMASAVDVGPAGRDDETGAGRLDTAASVRAATRSRPGPRVTPADGAVDVSWDPVPSAVAYRVRVTGAAPLEVTNQAARVTGLPNGVQTSVEVEALPDGSRSRPVLTTPGAPPLDAPVISQPSIGAGGDYAFSVEAVSGAAAYRIWENGQPRAAMVQAPAGVGWSTTGTVAWRTRFEVSAIDSAGAESPRSAPFTVGDAVPSPPPAPTGLTAAAGTTPARLSWAPVAGAVAYSVRLDGDELYRSRAELAAMTIPAGTHQVTVAAVDAWDQLGATSQPLVVVGPDPDPQPDPEPEPDPTPPTPPTPTPPDPTPVVVPPSPPGPAPTSSPASTGYRVVTADGRVYAYGGATHLGDLGGTARSPIVAAARTPSGAGYWLLAADGAVFTYGDARYFGGMNGTALNARMVAMTPTPSGAGYWLLGADGGVFSFGDATFYGSTGAMTLNAPIVDLIAGPAGRGYWLVATDGGIFSFGTAPFYGSTGHITLNRPVVSGAAAGAGYWMIGADGGIFAFGPDARFHGSLPGLSPTSVTGEGQRIRALPDGSGYLILTRDGRVYPFGAVRGAGHPNGVTATDLML